MIKSKDWSKKEITLLLDLSRKGHSIKKCTTCFPTRSYASIASKRVRLRKSLQLWGKSHTEQKKKLLEFWLRKFEPKYVIDAFAGTGSLTELYARSAHKVIACEYDYRSYQRARENLKRFKNIVFLNTSADLLLHSICVSNDGIDYDWIDLDPFGTVCSLIPLATDVLSDGYLCCTITELHSLRFGKTNPISWRYLLPQGISHMKVMEQLGYLLGWVLFDCSRRIFPRGSDLHKPAKIVKPIPLSFLGPRHNRLVRILLRVKSAKTIKEVKNYIFKDLKLFSNDSNLPYLEVEKYLINSIL